MTEAVVGWRTVWAAPQQMGEPRGGEMSAAWWRERLDLACGRRSEPAWGINAEHHPEAAPHEQNSH